MHPRHAALTQVVHAKLSGARGRLAETQIHGKNATPRRLVTAPSHTATMLIRTMKLLFSFEQVKLFALMFFI
jgi:hypothetical protein